MNCAQKFRREKEIHQGVRSVKALIIVDVQNDFMPGGALGVPEGNDILPVINDLLKKSFDFIIATKDWHPKEHGSFALNHNKKPGEHVILCGKDQVLWPTHCVQGTKGSEFAHGFDTRKVHKVFYKGTDREVDSYSAFFDNAHLRATGLGDFLIENEIDEVYIAGLATDYCVKYTVLDALKLGFKTYIVADGCKGINLNPDDVDKAIKLMQSKGAEVVSSESISL